jgi:fatty-acyl-CoA synthase
VLVHDIVRLNGKHRSTDEALVVGERRLTYGQLQDECQAVVRSLNAAGVQKGDRVAVLGRNSLEYLLLYFATAATGSILVPLNFWHRAGEHQHTVSDSTPRLLFVEPELEDQLVGVQTDARVIRFAGAQESRDAQGEWSQFQAAGAGTTELLPEVGTEDPHMILYTSGTTGRPKGALLSHGRTTTDALNMLAALRVRADDTYLNYFPPFHVGNWDHMKLFLMAGARVVLLRQFDAPEVLRLIAEERATVILGVPTMLHDLLSQPNFADTDKSSVRLVYYGAYDPSGIMRRTADAFGATEGRTEMAHTLGMTEAGPFVTLCMPHEVFGHWGSVGRPIPGVEVELRDDNGTRVGAGVPGEVCVRGPMMSGYWGNPEATAETLAGGWLHTGDIAVADEEGFLYIVDRKKDMIRSGGQNVYSKEIEDCLQMHPAVVSAAIIGLPDPRFEERVCAVVVLAPDVAADESTEEELRAHVRASLAGYNTPREFRFVPELPRNAVGKIQKHMLRDTYGSTFAAPRDPTP